MRNQDCGLTADHMLRICGLRYDFSVFTGEMAA
jgi:hypothetical protein